MSIPLRQHRLWIGPPLPDLYGEWIEEWRRLHPSPWQHVMWADDNLPPLENQQLWDDAESIAPKAVEQFRSDVARYEVLWRYGGVWLDVDFEPHRPIDELMDGQPWVVRHAGKWFANGVLAFPPGHPVMRKAIDKLPASVERAMPHWGNTRRSGPQFLTPILRPFIRSGEVRPLTGQTFIGYEWDRLELVGKANGVYATHHWNSQRRKRGMELTTLDSP